MQDVLILQLKGIGYYCNEFVKKGEEIWKETADFITKKSNEDGIEYALKKFGVI